MYKVDLNCDLGESFGNYKIGCDSEVIKYISSCNIACGFHASDPMVMSDTVKYAKENNVLCGAHPGFSDMQGFGRREMNLSYKEIKSIIQYQIGALYGFLKANNMKLQHVKPHGALYNMASKDYNMAKAICEGIYEFDKDIILLGLSGSELIKAAKDTNLKTANEVFADRAYNDDGSLVSRKKEGAVITDENLAIKRVVKMIKENKVTSINGKEIEIIPQSICVHGDNLKALEFVKKIRETLEREGILIKPLSSIV